MYAPGGQKSISDLLNLEFQAVMSLLIEGQGSAGTKLGFTRTASALNH